MKILILETRKLSYNSSSVFLSEICDILREYGVDVMHCIVNDPEKDSDLLESFIGKQFDAVLDINSVLPLAECDYGKYLDCIDAPFVNFIVDHPMHVHKYLAVKLKRYYVICLDKHHREYISKYYPHIKKATAIPLGGVKADSHIQFKKRKYHILFPATYTPSSYYRQILEETNISYAKQADQILYRILEGDTAPIHEMYKSITEWKDEKFAIRMYKARFIDKYIRDYIRDEVVDALLAEGFALHVVGARWDMYSGSYKDRLVLHRQCSYTELPAMMSDAKVVLNVQPLFTEAPHDRVFNAMLNGAVVLTDTCSYIEENYKNNILLYNKDNLKESIYALKDTLNDTHKLNTIVSNLSGICINETWEDRCKRIVQFVGSIS